MDPTLTARLTQRLNRLTEAGRVLSAPNEASLRSALAALQTVLAKIAKGETPDTQATEAAVTEAQRLLEEDLSFNDRERAIRAALKGRAPFGYCWLRDVYDDRVVFELEATGDGATSKLYQADYSMTDTGVVTLGEPVEVRIETRYVPITVPATENAAELTGDLVPLVEKAVRKDGTTTVKIIQPGWGSSGYYSAEMLERDGPKVFSKGLHMYVDHPTAEEALQRPERSIKDLAAVLESDATYQANGAAGPGLYADAKVLPAFAEHLEALAPHIGTSIRAGGKTVVGEAEGKRGPIIESIVSAQSVDFVTKPGAGGQVLQLFEAARGRTSPSPITGGQTVDPKEAQRLQESNATLTTQFAEQSTQLSETRTELQETRVQLARMQAVQVLNEAKGVVMSTLAAIAMPDVVRATLAERLSANPPVTEDKTLDAPKLIETVKAEAAKEIEYLQKAGIGTGQIRGMGTAGGAIAEFDESKVDGLLESAFTDFLGSASAGKIAATGR